MDTGRARSPVIADTVVFAFTQSCSQLFADCVTVCYPVCLMSAGVAAFSPSTAIYGSSQKEGFLKLTPGFSCNLLNLYFF